MKILSLQYQSIYQHGGAGKILRWKELDDVDMLDMEKLRIRFWLNTLDKTHA